MFPSKRCTSYENFLRCAIRAVDTFVQTGCAQSRQSFSMYSAEYFLYDHYSACCPDPTQRRGISEVRRGGRRRHTHVWL